MHFSVIHNIVSHHDVIFAICQYRIQFMSNLSLPQNTHWIGSWYCRSIRVQYVCHNIWSVNHFTKVAARNFKVNLINYRLSFEYRFTSMEAFLLVWISQWVCLIIRWFELCAHKESLSNLPFVLIILKPFSICILCIIQKRIKFVNFSTTEGKTCSFLRRILTTWCKSVSTKQINEKKLNTLHDQSKALHLEKQQNTTSDALGVDYKNGAGLTKSFYDRPTHVCIR